MGHSIIYYICKKNAQHVSSPYQKKYILAVVHAAIMAWRHAEYGLHHSPDVYDVFRIWKHLSHHWFIV